jgi:hypothetical protein
VPEESRTPQFPNIFLTLVSIVVALGIEHLLGHFSEQFVAAAPGTKGLVVAQGITMFVVIGAVWISYATLVMTTRWEPKFEDFYVPLLILSLLYFTILAIGTHLTGWFFMVSVGWAFAGLSQRFNLPQGEGAHMDPKTPEGRRAIWTLLGLSALSFVAGLASLFGAMNSTAATVIVSVTAVIQLLGSWLALQWWRST